MKKIFEYNGRKFYINVKFNTKMEKHINGKVFHTVNIIESGYDKKFEHNKEVEECDVLMTITQFENLAKEHINNDNHLTKLQKDLIIIGFK